jgi:3-phosphoshikimate 1-carboxyvinyltransferase
MLIRRAKYLRGEINLPGDKSISHRAAMIGSMATGTTRIGNYAASADCASTIECMRALGVRIHREDELVLVEGVGKKGFTAPVAPLDCGNSGTTMRLLAGILATQDFDSVLTGDESLNSRPMSRIADPLEAMGAKVETTAGRPPLKIYGGRDVHGIEHELKIASAQIKSCILLAGLNAEGRTTVIESSDTRDHTERMLRLFGVDVESNGRLHSVDGGAELTGCDLTVPSDVSAAAFFVVAAACLANSDVTMRNVGLNSTRAAILDVMSDLGGNIEISFDRTGYEPVGDVRVRSGFESGKSSGRNLIGGEMIPSLIDEVPILAILGTQLDGGIEIRNASELRVKESDRIAAVSKNLRRMGAGVEEFDDGLRVGKSRLKGAIVDSFGDHRIAMAFAIAGLLAEGETEIVGAECAAVSFPDFFDVLEDAAVYE